MTFEVTKKKRLTILDPVFPGGNVCKMFEEMVWISSLS